MSGSEERHGGGDGVERIREAALELFSSYWFESVSVAQICRHAGVSNGVYYRYYRSKDELFEYLLEDFLQRFGTDLASVGGATRSERLARFVETVSGAARRYAGRSRCSGRGSTAARCTNSGCASFT